MRSLLFVPSDSPRKLANARNSGADALIIDLEDSVAASAKAAARDAAADFLSQADSTTGQRLIVRINGFDSGLALADLEAIIRFRPHAIMLPKCRSSGDAKACGALLSELERDHRLPVAKTALIVIATETAVSLFNMGSYSAAVPRLAAITWGAEDLSADLGASRVRDGAGLLTGPYALARTLTLIAARSANVAPIDGIYPAFNDLDGLAREAEQAAQDGFTGKLAIHPAQVGPINAAFTPSQEAVAQATKIVAAFANDPDVGVVAIDGAMYDRPHLNRAEQLLSRAQHAAERQTKA